MPQTQVLRQVAHTEVAHSPVAGAGNVELGQARRDSDRAGHTTAADLILSTIDWAMGPV
jgi:hypothetical protein